MKVTFVSLLLTVVWLFTSCSDKHSPQDGHDHDTHSEGDGHDHGKTTPPAAAQHGVKGAVPGSYEDWCGEHRVPESKCTRCKASLVATFKASKDWCAEHGLPESQCLKCNPALKIERPPKPSGGSR